MNFLTRHFVGKSEIERELESKGFETSDCNIDCGSCNFKYPASIQIEGTSKLWNSTAPYDLHILIPSNKTDWEHNALEDKSLPFVVLFNKWIKKHASSIHGLPDHNIKVNVCSLGSHGIDNDPDYTNGKKGDLLILPQFVWVRNVEASNFDTLLPILNQIVAADTKSSLPLGTHGSLQVSIDPNQSWVFLCSHRKRDKRCGITAPIIKKEIDAYTRDLGHYRDWGDDREGGIQVAYVNHIGGHKYAANVIIYLKKSGKNVWLARISPSNIKPIVDECILGDGKIWVDNVRLIQKFKPADW